VLIGVLGDSYRPDSVGSGSLMIVMPALYLMPSREMVGTDPA
jgi:hypothetical protein